MRRAFVFTFNLEVLDLFKFSIYAQITVCIHCYKEWELTDSTIMDYFFPSLSVSYFKNS